MISFLQDVLLFLIACENFLTFFNYFHSWFPEQLISFSEKEI